MPSFAITDSGGDVLRIVTTPEPPEDLAAGEVSVPLAAFTGIPPRPAGQAALRVIFGLVAWVDVRTLAQAREDKLAELIAARDAWINAGVEFDGHVFDTDVLAQVRLIGLALAATIDSDMPAKPWRTRDGDWVQLTAADAVGLFGAVAERYEAAFAEFQAKEEAVNLAATIAQVQAISWSTPP